MSSQGYRKIILRCLSVRLARSIYLKKGLPLLWKFLYPLLFREPFTEIEGFIANFDTTVLYRVLSEIGTQDITSDNTETVRNQLIQFIYEEARQQCSGIEQFSPLILLASSAVK